MAYSQDDLDNINAAIASGADQAMIQGEMVKYRSLSDMRSIRNEIERAVSPSKAPTGIGQIFVPSTSRGL